MDLNTHVSDRKKRCAQMIKWAFALFIIDLQDIDSMPKGNVIIKKYRQRKSLASGKTAEYNYEFESIDTCGKQHHLPKRDPGSYLWEQRDLILRRRALEKEKIVLMSRLLSAIGREVGYSKGKISKRFKELMEYVKKAFYNKGRYERYKESSLPFLTDGSIVTDDGDSVRSKNECIFANKLKEMGIPYIYEARLKDVGVPDFTLFIGEEVIHIELLGKLDDKEYCEKLKLKKARYREMELAPVYIDMTYGVDTRKLESIITDIVNGELRGKQISCKPEQTG